MTEPEWEITFDGKNTKTIQALVGRMQNRDGDVDQVRFTEDSQLWIEDRWVNLSGFKMQGTWVSVGVGDTISKVGSMWVPKYGDSPVFRVTKGKL